MLCIHPVPPKTTEWGYDHLPWVFRKPDLHFSRVTGTGSVEAGLVRLVGTFDPAKSSFNRGPDSWISLDTYSVGFAHFWAGTAPALFKKMAEECPAQVEHAWGKDAVALFLNEDWLEDEFGTARGKMPHSSKLDWLVAGWYEISRHPNALRVQLDHWLGKYVPSALRYLRSKGWKKKQTLAGLVRVNNSGGMSSKFDKAIERVGNNEDKVLREVFMAEDLYDKPERYEIITTWPEFKGDLPSDWEYSSSRFDLQAVPVRVDGSFPSWFRSSSPDETVVVEPPRGSRPTLRRGAKGSEVQELQGLLKKSGASVTIDGDFGPATEREVKYFQETHLGPDGKFLDADGVVGSSTWWALDNQEGTEQKSNLDALIPAGLSGERVSLLEIAQHEWEIGIKEDPGGSNWSTSPEGGIAKYTAYDPSKSPGAWCMRFAKWCFEKLCSLNQASSFTKHAFSELGRSGSCSKTRKEAEELTKDGLEIWYDNDGEYVPIPGDMAIMDGHVFLILRVAVNSEGKPVAFNTIEGNSGNRVKCGYREAKVALGFVNLFGDAEQPRQFEFGTVDAEDVSRHSTR